MEHPLKIIQARHDHRERDHDQSENEQGFSPTTDRLPQGEGEDETRKPRNRSKQRSALAQGQGKPERTRRLVAERANDEGGNEEECDGNGCARKERGPEASRLANRCLTGGFCAINRLILW